MTTIVPQEGTVSSGTLSSESVPLPSDCVIAVPMDYVASKTLVDGVEPVIIVADSLENGTPPRKLGSTSSVGGHVSFRAFATFILICCIFTLYTDIVLCVVQYRAYKHGLGFHGMVVFLNAFWMCFQLALFVDAATTYYKYYFPKKGSLQASGDESNFPQPKCWRLASCCFRGNLDPSRYLILLALLMPMNALLFYNGLGSPVYTPSQLEGRDVTALLTHWPSGGGLNVDLGNRSVTALPGYDPIEPAVVISAKECYAHSSAEYQILARLQAEEFPKQAYCETLIGTTMAGWRRQTSDVSWQHDEDIWDETFEFALRLFTSLAGIIADQSTGENGNCFLKDMTDVFDMFMLTSIDATQMHEGRPLLAGNHGIPGYEKSFHTNVFGWLWVSMGVVLLRGMAILGFEPVVWLCRRAGMKEDNAAEMRPIVDASLSMLFLELPFGCLRWIAWRHYGVPVSVMGVKNLIGIYEDLHRLGIVRGFGEGSTQRRGLRLLWYSFWHKTEGEAKGGDAV